MRKRERGKDSQNDNGILYYYQNEKMGIDVDSQNDKFSKLEKGVSRGTTKERIALQSLTEWTEARDVTKGQRDKDTKKIY